MVRQCFKCKKLDFLNPNLAFHRFPRDPDKRKMWINILSLETQGVPKVCVICSDHFDESDFIYNARGVCVLKDDNVLPKYDSSQDQLIESGVKTEEIKIENSETVKNIESVADLNILDNCTIKNEILEDCTITKNTMVNEHKEIKEENESYHDQPDLVHVKFENSETTNELEKMDESALDEIAIKNEEVLLKEEGEEAAKSSDSSKYISKRKEENEETSRSMLQTRLFKSNDHGDFQCSQCKFKTTMVKYLNRHMNLHSPQHICSQCGYQTYNKSLFKRHLLIHKGPKKIGEFRCHLCELKTTFHSDLIKHFLQEHPEEVDLYKCDECDYRTKYKSSLKTHLSRHKMPKKEAGFYKCHLCPFKTFNNQDLMRHFLHKHQEEVCVYKCEKCDYQTNHKDTWKRHNLIHLDPKSGVCGRVVPHCSSGS